LTLLKISSNTQNLPILDYNCEIKIKSKMENKIKSNTLSNDTEKLQIGKAIRILA
jgi:hypothetical protein